MMHVFFFSFVRITTYSFLMLFKIPYRCRQPLWRVPQQCGLSAPLAVLRAAELELQTPPSGEPSDLFWLKRAVGK